jgi:redox-sensitive bicupin YhaK (pirin superfamily)
MLNTMKLRKADDRGLALHGWLKSRHTFSFANYHHPEQMGFRSLRVINEDRIEGGTGFGMHPHRDMEIISYVVKGALIHKDSMGTEAVIRPGEVQRMSAGSGIFHSEKNFADDEAHFFQIWILPMEGGGEPGYGQKSFEKRLNEEKLVLTISGDGRNGSISIKQDADLYVSRLKKNESLEFKVRKGRGVWVQVVSGSLTVSGQQDLEIATGDGLSLEAEQLLSFNAKENSEVLIFDLA